MFGVGVAGSYSIGEGRCRHVLRRCFEGLRSEVGLTMRCSTYEVVWHDVGIRHFRVQHFRQQHFRVQHFRIQHSDFSISEFCISEFCMSEFCMSEFCVSEFCVSEFCVSELHMTRSYYDIVTDCTMLILCLGRPILYTTTSWTHLLEHSLSTVPVWVC